MTPAAGDGAPMAAAYTTGFGVFKFVRLKRLKHSARNCKPSRSDSENHFANERSVCASLGPCKTLRPTLP
jgi:hypothetical protein